MSNIFLCISDCQSNNCVARHYWHLVHCQTLFTTTAMSYFFSTPVDIDIVLEDTDERAMVDVKLDKNRREKCPLYMDGETVRGAVTVRPKDGKRLEHTGIKVQFIGTIGRLQLWRLAHLASDLLGYHRDVLRPRHTPRVPFPANRACISR